MISKELLISFIQKAIPDAKVTVVDKTGTLDHFSIKVVSDVFTGKSMLDQHRLIYQALNEPMKNGRIHAIEITTETSNGH